MISEQESLDQLIKHFRDIALLPRRASNRPEADRTLSGVHMERYWKIKRHFEMQMNISAKGSRSSIL